ncbi:MAG: putative acyl-CoA dehydrogenase [Aeromicrobium sp.]|nr:putative acyl-CoA dehydrogenase [Aeromicrobium sp.]
MSAGVLTEEQRALAQMLRVWSADAVDLDDVRAEKRTPPDVGPIAEMGLLDLLAAESEGTVADLGVVHEQLGRAAAPHPVGSIALVTDVLARHAPEASGLTVPVLAATGRPSLLVERSRPGWRLAGTAEAVAWCADVERLAVFALDEGDNEVLALLPVGAAGVTIVERLLLDLSRSFVSIRFDDVELVETDVITGVAEQALLRDRLTGLAMADALGSADRLLEMTLDHVKSREQFGTVVGSFQAVKHHAANMRVDAATSRSALVAALAVVDSPQVAERSRAISTAAAYVFPACSRLASTALQLHGGMGFTWEHDLHVYLRRIKTQEALASPAWHRDRLIALL